MKNIAVALFTYRRPWHTRKVLESLRKNPIDRLYIFQDGLREEKNREDWQKVSDLIRSVDFAETEVHISDTNHGLANSIVSGLDYVFTKHDCVVTVEDDICLSGEFLGFMYACLEKYKANNEISSIAGGGCPVDIPKDYRYDVFFFYRFSCKAWGTWKDRWQQFSRDYTLFAKIMRDKEKKELLDLCGSDLYATMTAQVLGRCDSWALFWALTQINQKQVTVLPSKYLAKDIGFDGINSTHNGRTTRFDTELYEGSIKDWELPDQVVIDDEIVRQIRMVLNAPLAEERLSSHYSITRKWIACLQKGCSFADYFHEKGIRSLYIYGASDMGQLLFEQVKGLVDVKGFLERDKSRAEVCGCKVYEFSDNIRLENENIIVTPVHDWEYIVYSVNKRFGQQNFIHLMRMMDELCNRNPIY